MSRSAQEECRKGAAARTTRSASSARAAGTGRQLVADCYRADSPREDLVMDRRDSGPGMPKARVGLPGEFAGRLAGSSDLYERGGRRPYASVNFVACHDGFKLADLVSYNQKHSEANLEDNRDGTDDNRSWNCGVEGPTTTSAGSTVARMPETQPHRDADAVARRTDVASS